MERRTSLELYGLTSHIKSLTSQTHKPAEKEKKGPQGRQACEDMIIDQGEQNLIDDRMSPEVSYLSEEFSKKVSFQDSDSTITSQKVQKHQFESTAKNLSRVKLKISSSFSQEGEMISEKSLTQEESSNFGQKILNVKQFRNSLAKIITEQQ